MQIQSPLSNLRDVLKQVLASASNYDSTLKKNEAATRAVLVDPVLRALGWNTANSFMVEVEKTLGPTRADYALYDDSGGVKIIVEAKKLGENLNQHNDQLVQYAFKFKLASVFLTDGLIWSHYTEFEPLHFAPTRVLDFANEDLSETAAYLVRHLDAALFWPDEENSDVLAQQVGQLQSELSTIKQQIAALSVSTPDVTVEPHPVSFNGDFIPLALVGNVTHTRPSALRLPDGKEIEVNSWTDVLVESCKFVLKNCPGLKIPMKDKSGLKVNLFNVVEPPSNISYVEETYEGQVVYVYTNYSAGNKALNAQYIMKQLPKQLLIVEPAVVFSKINP